MKAEIIIPVIKKDVVITMTETEARNLLKFHGAIPYSYIEECFKDDYAKMKHINDDFYTILNEVLNGQLP